jgi:hypothetical protein
MSQGFYIARNPTNLASGKRRVYYVLRRSVWDREEKRRKTLYVAYLGVKPELPLSRAKKICKRWRIPLEALWSVRRLKIVDDTKKKGEVKCKP